MKDQTIDSSLPAGDHLGRLDADTAQTDESGEATVVFTATQDAQGTVTIQATHEWSSQKGDVRLTLDATADLTVGSLTGMWSVAGSEDVHECLRPSDNGTFAGTSELYLEQDDDTFTGSGSFPTGSALVTGTITRVGDAGFTLVGTADYVEEEVGTLRTVGVADFHGSGSIETQTIDLIWQGQDTQGDTCIFEGHGVATYAGADPSTPDDDWVGTLHVSCTGCDPYMDHHGVEPYVTGFCETHGVDYNYSYTVDFSINIDEKIGSPGINNPNVSGAADVTFDTVSCTDGATFLSPFQICDEGIREEKYICSGYDSSPFHSPIQGIFQNNHAGTTYDLWLLFFPPTGEQDPFNYSFHLFLDLLVEEEIFCGGLLNGILLLPTISISRPVSV
jgi:hypothetical protein